MTLEHYPRKENTLRFLLNYYLNMLTSVVFVVFRLKCELGRNVITSILETILKNNYAHCAVNRAKPVVFYITKQAHAIHNGFSRL